MNILYSCLEDLSKPCAQRTHVSEIVNNFAKLGHNVHLIALEKGNLKLHSNVKFYGIFQFINKKFLSQATLNIQKIYIKNLIKNIIKKEKIDIIYERNNDYDYGIKIGKKYGINTILELNGVSSQEAKLNNVSKKKIKTIDDYELKRIKYADKIIAITDGIKNYYSSLGVEKNKIKVISNGVNINLFKPMNKNSCRKKFGFDDFPIIGFVGSFRPYQGLENAINMMPFIIKEIPEARLVLIGDAGKYHNFQFHPTINELKNLAKNKGVLDNIFFSGRIEYNLVPFYINACDICIAPFISSDRNNIGGSAAIKIFEYLSCGKPVVCSSVKNIKEIIQQYNCGICVEPDNPKELAEKIIFLLKNQKMQVCFGNNGRKAVLKEFTWESIATKLLKEFMEI